MKKDNPVTPEDILSEATEMYLEIQKLLLQDHSTKSVAAWVFATAMLDYSAMEALTATIGLEEAAKLFDSFSLAAPLAVKELNFSGNVDELHGPTDDDMVH